MPDDRDYKVGYGKPPEHSRFKPGQSGNKKGRPKNSPAHKDLSDLLWERLDQPVELMLGGRPVRMSAKEALAHQIVGRAMKGDFKAVQVLDRLLGGALGRSSDQIQTSRPGEDDAQSESDAAVIDRFLHRQERQMPEDEDDDGGPHND